MQLSPHAPSVNVTDRAQLTTHAAPSNAAPDDEEIPDMLDSVDDPGDTDSPDVSQLTWPSADRIMAITLVALFLLVSVVVVAQVTFPARITPPVHVLCFPLTTAFSRGDRACSRSRPCPLGVGDCDADIACFPPLLCFKREQGESVPGVNVTGLQDHVDVCYDPACAAHVDADVSR